MGNLLFDTQPLVVSPELAIKIGLHEAIVIQQIHYWTDINEKAGRNLKEGFTWTYNTYDEWQKQFPFISVRTVRRTLQKLEQMNLIITGRFNKLSLDRTKWYRVNYPQLDLLVIDKVSNLDEPCGQSGQLEVDSLDRAIPETNYTEITTEKKDNGFILPNKTAHSFSEIPESVDNPQQDTVHCIVAYYYEQYKKVFNEEHPRLKKSQLARISGVIAYFMQENSLAQEDMEALVDRFLERDSLQTDYNLNHFATEGILQNLFWEVLY